MSTFIGCNTKVPEPAYWNDRYWWDRETNRLQGENIPSVIPSKLFDLLKGGSRYITVNNKQYHSRQEAIDDFWQARDEYIKSMKESKK